MTKVLNKVVVRIGKHAGRIGFVVNKFVNNHANARYVTIQTKILLGPKPDGTEYEEITIREANVCECPDPSEQPR